MSIRNRLFTWAITFALLVLCIVAGNWQLNKGLTLSQKNRNIAARSVLAAVANPKVINPIKDQWRQIKLDGNFNSDYRLIKNQYQEGQFGFHILQYFNSISLGKIAIDRGWVKAGVNATTAPVVPKIDENLDQIIVRVRSEFLNTHLGGTLFALPVGHMKSQELYFDLISGKLNAPLTKIELPDLSTGPHFAYAFQWYLFALLLVVGRIIWGQKVKL